MKAQQAATRDKARKPSWPPIRPHQVGGKTYWLVDAGKIAGRRMRYIRTTKTKAEEKAAEPCVSR